MAYMDRDSILDQMYEKQIFIVEILDFKMHVKRNNAYNNKDIINLGFIIIIYIYYILISMHFRIML